jgi:hypothetical protein
MLVNSINDPKHWYDRAAEMRALSESMNERPKEPTRSNVVNLMDALRQSVQAESARGSERRKLPRTEHRVSKRPAGLTRGARKPADYLAQL